MTNDRQFAAPTAPPASEQRLESLFNAMPVAIWEEDFSGVRKLLAERGLLQRAAPDVRAHLAHHPDVVAECVARVRIVDVNHEALRLHRARDKAGLLAGLDRLVTPESHEALVEQLVAIATGVTALEIDTRVRTLDGEVRDVHLRWNVVPGCEQTHARVIVSTTDITERRRAGAVLRTQAAALAAADDGIMITDRDGCIEWVNPAFERMTGYTLAEAFGQTPRILKSGAQDASFYEAFWHTVLDGQVVRGEVVNRRKDGTLYHEQETITPVTDAAGRVTHFIAIKQDITARKRAEEDLRESESRFRLMFERTTDALLLLDPASNQFIDCNQAAIDMLRCPDRQEMLAVHPSRLSPPRQPDGRPSPEKADEMIATAMRAGSHRFEWIHCSAHRPDFPVEVLLTPIPIGQRTLLLTTWRDITERKRAETAARHLASFPELNPNPVLEFAADGTLRYRNPASQAMAQRVGVSDVEELLPAETAAIVRECLATRTPRVRLPTRHGRHTLSWSFYPIALTETVHCYAGDVTERLQLEEQLRQSQKMDAIGHLAGGVAHDFNNLLTVIQGNTSMLKLDDLSADQRAEALQEIAQAAERAAGLTRQLLAFSRRQVMQVRQLDLNDVVTNLARMLQRIVGEDVRLQLNLHPRPLPTQADAGMLDQVLMNLVVNARDAMPDGGQLFLETTECEAGAADVALFSEAQPGPHVVLRVRDTGCGITPEDLPHIFEPFFTTKEPGKGTGLGLATVFGIVRQHRGVVRVASEVGRGATFEILLSVAAGGATATGVADVTRTPRGGTESILLVEDEGPLRRLVERVLTMHGYRVLVVATGDEVLRHWNSEPVPTDLLLTDIIMPGGVSGGELAERLRAQRPGLPVIYMSGYTGDVAGRGLHLHEGVNFLQKPFSPAALLDCVRACLDAS